MLSLNQVILDNAYKSIVTQDINGDMPPGHNGPYQDPETPVRNTAHWLVTFCHLYEQTGEKDWYIAAQRATDYLLSKAARPMHASFFCRRNPEKDFCNGLIGQAWALEGLIAAGQVLGREDAIQTAREVFYLHPFLEDRAIWRKVSVDGSYLGPDGTFNHQLWFAAVSSLLNDTEVNQRVTHFLNRITTEVQIYSSGVIFHKSKLGRINISKLKSTKYLELDINTNLSWFINKKSLLSKSIGYHGFNLYAFALLKQKFPEHSLWTSPKFRKILNVTRTDRFKKELADSVYGYPYNPPGFELAFVGEVFGLGFEYSQEWINAQIVMTYDLDNGCFFRRSVSDQITLLARFYEATRCKNTYTVRANTDVK